MTPHLPYLTPVDPCSSYLLLHLIAPLPCFSSIAAYPQGSEESMHK